MKPIDCKCYLMCNLILVTQILYICINCFIECCLVELKEELFNSVKIFELQCMLISEAIFVFDVLAQLLVIVSLVNTVMFPSSQTGSGINSSFGLVPISGHSSLGSAEGTRNLVSCTF